MHLRITRKYNLTIYFQVELRGKPTLTRITDPDQFGNLHFVWYHSLKTYEQEGCNRCCYSGTDMPQRGYISHWFVKILIL